MNSKYNLLVSMGFSPNDSKVYLYLLDAGKQSAHVISKNIGIHRTNVYDALQRLSKKGMIITLTEKNRKLFKAKEPLCLLNIIDARRNLVEETFNLKNRG